MGNSMLLQTLLTDYYSVMVKGRMLNIELASLWRLCNKWSHILENVNNWNDTTNTGKISCLSETLLTNYKGILITKIRKLLHYDVCVFVVIMIMYGMPINKMI